MGLLRESTTAATGLSSIPAAIERTILLPAAQNDRRSRLGREALNGLGDVVEQFAGLLFIVFRVVLLRHPFRGEHVVQVG